MAITIALHLALLMLLIRAGSIPTARRLPSPLPISLTLPEAAVEAAASVAANPPADAPDETPRPLPPGAPGLPPELPIPVLEAEPFDFPALTPQFDVEPDPAVTGDVTIPASRNVMRSGASVQCPLAASVRQALEQNVEAKAALARIPPQSRSVANAVMLWDGEWIASERVGGQAALGSVQKAIAGALGSASADCRSRSEAGPIFLILNSPPDTIVLALGSGAWRWSDLLINIPENKY